MAEDHEGMSYIPAIGGALGGGSVPFPQIKLNFPWRALMHSSETNRTFEYA